MSVKTIIAAVDFSDISNEIIEKAGEFASRFSAHLWILHVAAPDPDFVGYGVGPKHVRQWRADELHDERKFMQQQADMLKEKGINTSSLLIQGPTAETILKEISKLNADLIVLGSHGHSTVYELLVGSVTEAMLRKSPCPVLVVPARKQA